MKKADKSLNTKNKMLVIYQIGRLDKNIEEKIKFKIQNYTFQEPLSSFALRNYLLQKTDNKIFSILIYPVSLPFNKTLYDENSTIPPLFKDAIRDIIKQPSKYNPEEFFKLHPHTRKADDFITIHSIGEYENVKFCGHFNDIMLEILCDMIERYIETSFKTLFIDISSGHNISVSALLEATKHFSVFTQLMNWKNKENIPEIYIVYSDPIIGSSLQQYHVYLKQIKFKAFFSSPVKYEEVINYALSNKLTEKIEKKEERRRRKNKIQDYIETFCLLFSGIKNNIPLSLYTFQNRNREEIIEFLKSEIRRVKGELYRNWKSSPNLNVELYLKLILSLGMYIGIMEVLRSEEINKYDNETGLSLSEIKQKFASRHTSLYKYFGIPTNIEWLGNEVSYLEVKLNNKIPPFKEWRFLRDFIKGESKDFRKRNFLAHCGFERNITQVRKEETGEIFVRWIKDEEENIKKKLLEEV